jgi:hypothetical protein
VVCVKLRKAANKTTRLRMDQVIFLFMVYSLRVRGTVERGPKVNRISPGRESLPRTHGLIHPFDDKLQRSLCRVGAVSTESFRELATTPLTVRTAGDIRLTIRMP